ncbi:MAG: phosphoribosylanthranilate isomerase [Acidimicrobiales bacterium]
MFVKICGITNEEDALLAVAMGADAVGFVFAPSPRQIAPAAARDIVRRLPYEVVTVGVFRDQSAQQVVEIVNQLGLRGAQLHGHESPAEAEWVRRRVPFVIKAFAAGDRMFDRMGDYEVDAILVDSAVPGSGQVFDWTIAEHLPLHKRIIVAGGLTPENVGEAIRRFKPWGVDVASGVESSPGRKDALRVMRFVNAAKAFEEGDADPVVDLGEGAQPALYDYDWEEDTFAG